MDKIHQTAAGAIGETPLVYLNRIAADLPAKIAVKLEYMNPTCSVKDRAASAMIDQAEMDNKITPGKTVLVEATSGNMGIALAFYAKMKGYKIVLVMPCTASLERRALMLAFGAELIITPPEIKGKALIDFTENIAKSDPNFFWMNQFSNEANQQMHYRTTGPEIWSQTQGKVDIVCFGVGSGGTVTGTGRFLREKKPEVEVHAVEPYESSVISGFEPNVHKIQGIGAGFVPGILKKEMLTSIMRIKSDDAVAMAKRLALEESILGGISSGANVLAAVELAKLEKNAGKLIVTSINSSGERYLSTVLYSDTKEKADNLPHLSLEKAIETAKKLLPTA